MKLVILLFAAVAAVTTQVVRYDGFQVLRTAPLEKAGAEFLKALQTENNVDFWQNPIPGRSADIAVAPELLPKLKGMLRKQNIAYNVMIEDVQK